MYGLISSPRQAPSISVVNENQVHRAQVVTEANKLYSIFWLDVRSFVLCADGALGVHGQGGVKDPLSQVNESVVPVADRQALCLEQNAGLPIVRHAQRAIRPHQGLKQLPFTVRHPGLMPVKGLQTDEEKRD